MVQGRRALRNRHEIFWKKTGTEEPEQPGVVVSILERRRTRFVGLLRQSSKGLFVLPDDPRFSREIRVSPPKATRLRKIWRESRRGAAAMGLSPYRARRPHC